MKGVSTAPLPQTPSPPDGHEWLALADDPREVEKFCRKLGIDDVVGAAIRLARKHFAPNSKISLSLDGDPAWNDHWLVVRVITANSIEEAARAYDEFLHNWVNSASWATRRHIRISYCVD